MFLNRYTAHMTMITPINAEKENEVIKLVEYYIEMGSTLYKKKIPAIKTLFDLKGRTAGMYKIERGKRMIRFNPYHFAKYPEENFSETIPHEVAHFIIDQIYGMKNVRPHGKEWKALMLDFGVEPKRAFSYSLEGIPTKMHKRHSYVCGCMKFEITTRRHNMIQQGKAKYLCRECGGKLNYQKHCIS